MHLAEAHAEDEWPIGSPVQVLQHTSLRHRIAAAQQFSEALQVPQQLEAAGVNLTLTVDTMHNDFHSVYGSWPAQWFLACPEVDTSTAKPQPGQQSLPLSSEPGDMRFTANAFSPFDTPDLNLDSFAQYMLTRFGEGEEEVCGFGTALITVPGLAISASNQPPREQEAAGSSSGGDVLPKPATTVGTTMQ